ncbi:hypothetical protein B0G75_11488 [Paraburkholderia sp. BL18I3N2]|nr:hypothetical protein B0G75_11488 [Paraburkholderia sp. BL18I3N2]
MKKRWRRNQSAVQREMALLAARSCSEAFGVLRVCTARRMVLAHVALYGVVDSTFTYLSNQRGHANFHMSQDNLQASKFGLLGSEDIGGGRRRFSGSIAASNR